MLALIDCLMLSSMQSAITVVLKTLFTKFDLKTVSLGFLSEDISVFHGLTEHHILVGLNIKMFYSGIKIRANEETVLTQCCSMELSLFIPSVATVHTHTHTCTHMHARTHTHTHTPCPVAGQGQQELYWFIPSSQL